MSDEDLLLSDDAPPFFDLPPPPRPPWLEDPGQNCQDGRMSKSQILSQLETCDNTLISGHFNDGSLNLEDTFHSAAVVLVCSIVFVIIIMAIGIYAFR